MKYHIYCCFVFVQFLWAPRIEISSMWYSTQYPSNKFMHPSSQSLSIKWDRFGPLPFHTISGFYIWTSWRKSKKKIEHERKTFALFLIWIGIWGIIEMQESEFFNQWYLGKIEPILLEKRSALSTKIITLLPAQSSRFQLYFKT